MPPKGEVFYSRGIANRFGFVEGGVRELSWCGGDGVGDHERCDCPGSGPEYILFKFDRVYKVT